MRQPTPYVHNLTGRPVVISEGIGPEAGPFGVFYELPSGSLRRVKAFPMRETTAQCFADLTEYKGRAIVREEDWDL